MYKIFSTLLIFFALSLSPIKATSLFNLNDFDPEDSTRFTIQLKTFKPSRIYGVITNDPNAQNSNSMDYGFGGAVNFLNFEYSPIFETGDRFTLYYSFANGYPVNPYIGISYIQNTDIYDKPTKSKIDGYDGLLGIEVSYFKYIVPYFEYMPYSSLWMFGVRFKLSVIIDKRDAPQLNKDAQQQSNTNNPATGNTANATGVASSSANVPTVNQPSPAPATSGRLGR
ncbi:MAG: hypothetical protein LBH40_06495 [Alphaproteobacteria bacterium]|jgi:hypothetical protein|nr:hypothetical protein [Alphaproteobacteria bacterium]